MTNCFVCNNESVQSSQQGFNAVYNCMQCGIYIVPTPNVPRLDENLRPIISGYIREHQDKNKQFHLTQEIVDKIQKMPIPTIQEKILKLMHWLEKQTTFPGDVIKIKPNDVTDTPELIAIIYARNMKEVRYYLEHLKAKNFLIGDAGTPIASYRITVDGFGYLESERKKINSDLCFCAMSFSQEHDYIYEKFIQPAVQLAGYKCIRVDEDPHNNGVVDKIKALILQSKFVIADLTGNKNGVYYEAGWAGRGEQEVIFTCEESDFDKIHFDVQHLNFLKWNKDKISEAVEKLKWRIEGTIGRGAFSQE